MFLVIVIAIVSVVSIVAGYTWSAWKNRGSDD